MKPAKKDMKFIFKEKVSVDQVNDGLVLTNGFCIEDYHYQD